MNIFDECEQLQVIEDDVTEGIPPLVVLILVVVGVLVPTVAK